MPNGGSDNCGMCLWNRTEGDRTNEGFCELRKVSVLTPYWTYCGNFDFWREELPLKHPVIKGPIYSSGIFEGYYTRIPWYGNNEPRTYSSGICTVTGVKFNQGISVIDKETDEKILFATNDIYCRWIKERTAPAQPVPQAIRKESTGDKELHGIYTELFHQGSLCCDFMHLGKDMVFDDDLDYEPDDQEDPDNLWLRDKIRGAILCGAIGDAMGRQVESMNPGSHHPVTWYSPWRGWKSGPIGTITDDTQMTWWLAESLLHHNRLNPDDVAARFTREHIRGIGSATRQFVGNYKDRKQPWYQAGVPSSGNGVAMRSAPVGIFFRNDFDELKLAAGLQAIITHNDRMAVASSIVVAFAVARLLRMNTQHLVDIGQKTLFCRELADAIAGVEGDGYTTRKDNQPSSLAMRIGEDIPAMLSSDTPPQDAQNLFWSGAYVLESLPFALYCFLYSPGDFDRVLFNSVNESRDSDTVAAMACTFCGALNGLDENMDRMYWTKIRSDSDRDTLPEIRMKPDLDYLDELEYRRELINLADKLTSSYWSYLTDDLTARIKEKTAAVAARVFRKGFEIILNSGRVITMGCLEQRVTYADVLEGWPNKARNDRRIDELIRKHTHDNEKPHVLNAPRDIITIEADEVRHFNKTSCPQPELLPYITCFARFYSEKPARSKEEYCTSYISMIWFQNNWAMPIAPEVLELLKAVDWDNLAFDAE